MYGPEKCLKMKQRHLSPPALAVPLHGYHQPDLRYHRWPPGGKEVGGRGKGGGDREKKGREETVKRNGKGEGEGEGEKQDEGET